MKSFRIVSTFRLTLLFCWLSSFAVGPVALHSLAECSHNQAAETVEHQESNHAHWAALRSIELPEAECSICASFSSFHFDAVAQVNLLFDITSEKQTLVNQWVISALFLSVTHPRAPPIA